MLVAVTPEGSRTTAWDAVKGAPYQCPVCGELVILHRGAKVIAHYAHRPGSECTHEGESREHVIMKQAVWSAMRTARGVTRCELEWPIGARRADVYVETEHGYRVAVEGQVSHKEEPELEQKIADYRALDVLPLYLVHAKAFKGYDSRYGMGSLHEREVRVPNWVLALALVDPSAEQPLQTYDIWSGREYQLHSIVQVFDGTDAWLVRLEPLWRDSWDGAPWYMQDQYNPKQLRLVRVVGRLDLTRGPEAAWHPNVREVGDHAWVAGTPALLGPQMRPSDRPASTPACLVSATAEYRAYMRARAEAQRQAGAARERKAARARRWLASLPPTSVIPLPGAAASSTSPASVASAWSSATQAPATTVPAASAQEQFDLGFAEPQPARRRARIED